jgi:hypothetical protein
LDIVILKEPPISGCFVEYQFDVIGDCTWVLFNGPTSNVIGVFGKGSWPDSSITTFNSGQHALVLASGQGYILELSNMKLTHKTIASFLRKAIAIPETALIVACDFLQVHIYSTTQMVWESEQLGVDDLKIDKVTKNAVSGTFWNGREVTSFELDISAVVAS